MKNSKTVEELRFSAFHKNNLHTLAPDKRFSFKLARHPSPTPKHRNFFELEGLPEHHNLYEVCKLCETWLKFKNSTFLPLL